MIKWSKKDVIEAFEKAMKPPNQNGRDLLNRILGRGQKTIPPEVK